MAIDQKVVDRWVSHWIRKLMKKDYTANEAHALIKETNYNMRDALKKAEERERAQEE